MIDLHSHVLPGLDDGSRSLEQSVEMVRMAAAAGTTDLVASPHANLEYAFDTAVVERKLAELADAAQSPLRLHYGCDFHFFYDNIQDALANPRKFTIGHRTHLLVEFPDVLVPNSTGEIFDRMIAAGIVPVITHPERNYLLHMRLPQLKEWAAKGVLLQVTGQSFLGRFGAEVRRFAEELMHLGLVHVVASDAHDTVDRTPRLDQAYRHIGQKYGEAWARQLLVENPACALRGEPLPPQPPPPPRRRWYAFWKR